MKFYLTSLWEPPKVRTEVKALETYFLCGGINTDEVKIRMTKMTPRQGSSQP